MPANNPTLLVAAAIALVVVLFFLRTVMTIVFIGLAIYGGFALYRDYGHLAKPAIDKLLSQINNQINKK